MDAEVTRVPRWRVVVDKTYYELACQEHTPPNCVDHRFAAGDAELCCEE